MFDAETVIQQVDPLVGTLFDQRFRVEERIAAGGFGAIYRAKHVKSGHDVALKVLLPELARDLGVVARFRREGSTLVALRNPHTIAAYELGQSADRTLFIVMELLHGVSLFERYRERGPFEWKRMVKIAREVCESLAEAHDLGIVHRDLKPTNIHLEEHKGDPDFVKVLDFGIAKILRGSDFDASDITNAGQMIGTLDYMSPEQMVGGAVTGQTDIYTLGIVMYEMIAGTTPFPEAMTAAAALNAMLKTKPQPLYLRAPIPEELDRIVMRCLERDTNKRWPNVMELSNALAKLVGAPFLDHVRTAPVPKSVLDNDSTTINQPPEMIDDVGSNSTVSGLGQTTLAESVARWGDDDEFIPTARGKRHDIEEHTVPAHANARAAAPMPAPRPLPRQQQTPIPQLVAAPFSVRRTPTVPPPRPPTPLPPHLASPVPGIGPPLPRHVTPLPLPPPHEMMQRPSSGYMPYPPPEPPQRKSFDMGQLAAREDAIRRFVWIIVLLVAAGVGAALASLL